MTFFLIFPIKQVLTFHEIVSTEDNLHMECQILWWQFVMECQNLCSGKNEKKKQKKKQQTYLLKIYNNAFKNRKYQIISTKIVLSKVKKKNR